MKSFSWQRQANLVFRPQTAIRGVLSVGLINITARLIAYGKHIVIAAFIGLSAQLDAFYMATTVLALAIFVFGDVFRFRWDPTSDRNAPD